jgi:four helix bundle protein
MKNNDQQFNFEKLQVWQLAKELTIEMYQITKSFPADERYGLVSQIRRASTSICANLTEGSTRITPKDQAHFTTVAYGSLIELLNHLIIAHELEYIETDIFQKVRADIKNLAIKLSNYKRSQLSNKGKKG